MKLGGGEIRSFGESKHVLTTMEHCHSGTFKSA